VAAVTLGGAGFLAFLFQGLMTSFAADMGRFLEGGQFFVHAGLGIVAGITFLDLLSFRIGSLMAVIPLGVVAGGTVKVFLVHGMGEKCWFCLFGRINGGFQNYFCRSFFGGQADPGQQCQAAYQGTEQKERLFH